MCLEKEEPPTWEALAAGARPPIMEPEEMEPGGGRGWQHAAASKVEYQHREELFVHMRPSHRAQVRSQAGPGAGMALSSAPVNYLTRIPPHLFRVVLLRRLRLPLPLSLHTCRCGRQIDKFGHHRASCARAGVLGRRGFALESETARVCREPGGRVTTNIMVRDLDLAEPRAADGRRLEVVVDGLPLFGGCQLAVDTTVVCALHCDGSPHRGADNLDGVVLERARRRKERTYPELVGQRRRARLVVRLETTSFLSQLAKARSRQETALMRRRVEQAWRMRWGAILACATARAVATSLLNLCTAHGADGNTPPVHEVEGDHKYAGLVPRSVSHVRMRPLLTFASIDFIPSSFGKKKKKKKRTRTTLQDAATSLDGNNAACAWSDNGNTSGLMASGACVTFSTERIAHVIIDNCRLRGQSG